MGCTNAHSVLSQATARRPLAPPPASVLKGQSPCTRKHTRAHAPLTPSLEDHPTLWTFIGGHWDTGRLAIIRPHDTGDLFPHPHLDDAACQF